MEPKVRVGFRMILWSWALWVGVVAPLPALAQTVVYSTRFEAAEGYVADASLTGQQGWVGSGADGVLTNFFGDGDQQAYIGYAPPVGGTNDYYYTYRPINLAPIPPGQNLVTFSVLMQIVDSSSTNGPWDDFRWSIYNTNGTRLFSIDFDVSNYLISYVLDDGAGFVSTGRTFDMLGQYELAISMNFARNLWTATLNGEVLINAKPLTTIGTPLNLGDVDAIWSVRDPKAPGDNYMVFDDYQISAQPAEAIPPRLEFFGRLPDGSYQARLYGEPGKVYRIEASADLTQWQPLLTVTSPAGGILDFQDPTAGSIPRRFYRARQAP